MVKVLITISLEVEKGRYRQRAKERLEAKKSKRGVEEEAKKKNKENRKIATERD